MIPCLISAALGYLLGCSNMALYLAKLKGVDIRAGGTGNPGASNAMVLMGWWAGVITAFHDIGKSALAVYLARRFCPDFAYAGLTAGFFAVLGHMFPVFMRFRGGKGLASYFGMILAIDWKFAMIMVVVGVLLTLITDYIVVATVTFAVVFPIYAAVKIDWTAFAIVCAASVIMLSKHRENFRRLADGTEIGLRRANSGKLRADRKDKKKDRK